MASMETEPKIRVNRGNAGKGRPKGSLNKATADVKVVAQQYTEEAVDRLASIMRDSDSDAAKVSAIKELLDRGHGKATTVIGGDPDGAAIKTALTVRFV